MTVFRIVLGLAGWLAIATITALLVGAYLSTCTPARTRRALSDSE